MKTDVVEARAGPDGGASLGIRLLSTWDRTQRLPMGNLVFSFLAGRMVPYTGTIRSRVTKLRAGHAEVTLRDRRAVRNHLGSIHAVALVNLGEFASGLAFITSLRSGLRAIVTELTAEYLKKARGTLVARSTFDGSRVTGDSDQVVTADIMDGDGTTVARVTVTWKVQSYNP